MNIFCLREELYQVCFSDFYGKGAGYSILAAKDATYALAKWSLEKKDMHHDLVTEISYIN